MLQLRCTKKVQALLGLRPHDLREIKSSDAFLGNWYVNLFVVDRRKTLLFMNERTLLSFVIFGVRKDKLKKVPEAFLRGVDQMLTLEGFDFATINRVYAGYEDIEFTRTDSRSVLGNLNDLMEMYKDSILREGGFRHCDLAGIMLEMNRMPQRNLGWSSSVDIVRELLRSEAKAVT